MSLPDFLRLVTTSSTLISAHSLDTYAPQLFTVNLSALAGYLVHNRA
jgi:hypothetical protein